ncbi:MAG: AMP-binding protein [Clostridia bacterium]|nr:AMP-binding protein [Clostridia bacterium]
MDLESHEEGVYSIKELIEKGKKLIEEGDRSFLDAEIDENAMDMMLFTSGTTSGSKAVALSHKILCTNIMDIASVLDINKDDTLLSFLPLHHAFGCTIDLLYTLYRGSSVAFCEGIRHIVENLREYKITVMISVPILFESIYKKLMKGIEKQGKLDKVKKGRRISNALRKMHIDVRKKLFKEIHDILGGELRLCVSGAAALDVEVERGFNELGIRIVQGYGLTETAPVISTGTDDHYREGSVGQIFPSLEARVVDSNEEGIGEIQVKGPSVMIGYYNNEEANKQVFTEDGYFRTGDLGYIDKDGYFFISGRKKSVIVLKNGKNVFPEELENLVNRIEGVAESMVYGKPEKDGDVKICVKVVYDEEAMKEMYKTEDEAEIYEIIQSKVKEVNKKMPLYKYIREVMITKEPLIKTTTAKIKRHEELAKIL